MRLCLVLAMIFLPVIPTAANAQYSFDFRGGGARSEGMGKAYLSISDDVYGGSWNPAGVYTIDKPVLGVSWGSLAPRGAANASVISPVPSHLEHSGFINSLNSLSFAAPVRVKGHPFVGCLSFSRNFNIYEAFESEGMYPFIVDTTVRGVHFQDTLQIEERLNSETQGGLNSLVIGFGTRLYSNVSFGVSANVYTGSALHEENTRIITDNAFHGFLQRGYEVRSLTVADTNKFSGVNMTMGFKYTGDKASAGLVIKTPFTLRVSYDILNYYVTTMNGFVVDQYTDTIYHMDNVTNYDMPWIVGAGFAYQISDNLLFAADTELRAFKGGKINVRESVTINPAGDNLETFVEYDPRWNNVVTVRLGTEYLVRTSAGAFPIRAGGGYCPSPYPNYNSTGESSRAKAYYASLGTGVHWGQIQLDIAYSLLTMDRHAYGLVDYTNRNHHVNVSFTGVF